MLTKSQLLDAIDELESMTTTYQDCEKLATFYLLYDHLYGDKKPQLETTREVMIGKYGESDFLKAVDGKEAETVWQIMDELMDSVQAFQPRLYNAVLQQLRE